MPIPSPIPTPNLPFSNIVNVVPPPPQDPPTDDDVYAAKQYVEKALTAEKYAGNIDRISVVGALIYQDSILAAASGGHAAPPWFQAALDLALQPLKRQLSDTGDKIEGIYAKIDHLISTLAKNQNRALGDGEPVSFVPVPFADGSMPSANPATPTPLTSVAVILSLGDAELAAYCHAYYPGQGYDGLLQGNRNELKKAIGCSANV
ncbi:hypothetical protein C8R45DRAFT_950323 [Mycena sanguinolenta]|nr:hypothetical protein C8R45DRAFT_950323 [Mycena sanguinolenta]